MRLRGSTPLRRRLMLIAVVAILPVVAAAGIAMSALVREQWREAEAKSLEVTRLASAGIEVELHRTISILHALASSPLLDRAAIGDYRAQLARDMSAIAHWHSVTLALPDGRIVTHAGTTPARLDEGDSFQRVLNEGRPAVGRLIRVGEQWTIPVRVPVRRDGALRYVLTAQITPDALVEVVESQALPPTWVMSVFDQTGARIARSRDQSRYLGTPATPSLKTLIDEGQSQGTGITHTLEGTEVYTAYIRIPISGWVTAIGIPTAAVRAGAWRAFAIYGGGTLASLFAGLLLAALVSRGISGPIAQLRMAASRMGRGETPAAPPSDIRELDDLGAALVAAATARERMEADRESALAELAGARDRLKQQVSDLERLHRLGNELLRIVDLGAQLEAILAALCELHDAPKGIVSLCSRAAGGLEMHTAIGFSERARARLKHASPGEGACGLAMRDGCVVVIEDTEADLRFADFRDLARSEGLRSVHCTPIRGSAGRVLGVISTHAVEPRKPGERESRLADLCAQLCSFFIERQLAEAGAAESELRLTVALDSSTIPFSILAPVRDASGVIVDFVWEYLNRAAAREIGGDAHALVGQAVGKVAPATWTMPGVFECYVAVAEAGRGREVEVCASEGDPPRCLQVVANPFQGKVAVWVADVTQRKEQERTLQTADRRKDEFLAVLAHELRNPLAPIQQAAIIASAPAATEAQQRWSQEVIARQVRHMALLLDDLLDVSRITRGKLELRRSQIELRSVVDAALETARPHLAAKGHQLRLELPEAPVHLNADPLRVAQVITNLLTNAARYTEAGGAIRLSAGAGHGQAWVAVEDNGMGIAPEHLDRIFEMFAQGRPRGSAGGLGIGLALSRGIAQLHGGALTATSRGPGLGSRFTLTLPLGEASSAAAPRVLEPGIPMRILVADDNRDAAETLASLLRLNGHQVEIAYDGEAALRVAERTTPDVALLDIGMPALSGYEVARRLRAAGSTAVLVALTGWGQARDKANATDAGFDHHLTKPVDLRALFEILRARSPADAGREGSRAA